MDVGALVVALFPLGYVAIGLVVGRRVYVRSRPRRWPTWRRVVAAGLGALVWPIVIAVWSMGWLLTGDPTDRD